MVYLTIDEFQKLSKITGIQLIDLEKLYSLHLLKDRQLLMVLIKHDYYTHRRRNKYTPAQIYVALERKYQVTKSFVLNSIHFKPASITYCEKCHRIIKKFLYNRNNGLCDECVAEEIII